MLYSGKLISSKQMAYKGKVHASVLFVSYRNGNKKQEVSDVNVHMEGNHEMKMKNKTKESRSLAQRRGE